MLWSHHIYDCVTSGFLSLSVRAGQKVGRGASFANVSVRRVYKECLWKSRDRERFCVFACVSVCVCVGGGVCVGVCVCGVTAVVENINESQK